MLETEVKFYGMDFAAVRCRLRNAGAVSHGGAHEMNYRFDAADHRLRDAGCLLRLRRDRRNLMTFKKPSSAGGRQFKTFEELEIEISDFDTARVLLEALGFHRVQAYEKYRETFAMAAVEICLDRLPYGDFIEIEGPPEAIPKAAETLGLLWPTRILANYLQIFEALRQSLELPFRDVTFAEFDQVQADMTPLIRRFEAGAVQ